MKTIISILLFSSLCKAAPIAISATDAADIKINNGEVEVSLPKAAKTALINWNPEFIIFNLKDYSESILALFKEIDPKSTPMAFIADLDNNGEQDVVLLGSDLKQQYAVALMQKNKKWTPVKITSWEIADIKNSKIPASDIANKKAETGIPIYVLPAQDEHAKKLGKKVGIQVETYAGPASVYEIKDGKAVTVQLK